jgi:isopentenyl-diphosphate delta-isomerase
VAASYVERAEAAGYDAVVLTVDAQVPRWRQRLLETGYRKAEVTPALPRSDPAVERLAERRGESVDEVAAGEALAKDRSITWDDLAFLRDHTDLPLLLKGILRPADARRAVDHADGIVVSNHGGRQVDRAGPALEQLPDVVDAVGDDAPVLFDSGIRHGADAAVALALGADAVLLGRPYAYGLALAGEAGVMEVCRNLLADLDITLGLAGYRSFDELDRDALSRAP